METTGRSVSRLHSVTVAPGRLSGKGDAKRWWFTSGILAKRRQAFGSKARRYRRVGWRQFLTPRSWFRLEPDFEELRPVLARNEKTPGTGVVSDAVQYIGRGVVIGHR